MLNSISIPLWIFSLVCDVIYAVGWGGISWNDMAFNTMAGGLLGALAAAIPEYLDYRSFRNPTPSNRTMADADQAFHCGVVRGQFVAPNGK